MPGVGLSVRIVFFFFFFASNEVYIYGLPPVPRADAQPFRRKSNLFNFFVVVQLPCDTVVWCAVSKAVSSATRALRCL
eukprot:2423739-Prymnesium_polylepis.1